MVKQFEPTPENELGALLEVAQGNFGLQSPEDHAWLVERTRADPECSYTLALLLRLSESGFVTFNEERRPDTGAPWIYARITASGRKRIGELYAAEVKPSPDWSPLDFDETGLPQV